jgi:HemK-like putative methylase
MLKQVFLARLLDQPLAYRYPAALITLASSKSTSSLKAWVEARAARFPKTRVYQDLWWELQGAINDCQSIAKSPDARHLYRLVTRRAYPTSYVDDTVTFMDCKIRVKSPILIPRYDTEAWLVKLVPSIQAIDARSVLDVGFGSGCISLGLAHALGDAIRVTGIDRSPSAYRLALANKLTSCLGNVEFRLCDLADYRGVHDVVVSNPPYIRHCDRPVNVSPSTRRWESASALHPRREPPDDGTRHHRMLVNMIHNGAIYGCRLLAMELDGTRQQYDAVRAHVEETFSRSEYKRIEPVSDGRRKLRAIKIVFDQTL